MEQPEEAAFDAVGFLSLLADGMRDSATGVVTARIHVRDGRPWAIAVEFEEGDERAA